MDQGPGEQPTIFYGWWIVAACFTSMLIAGGATFFALPVFLKPLAEEFRWSRAEVSGGIAVFLISVAVGSPLVGGLTSRYGARKVMVPAAILAGLSLILLAWLTRMWQFYALRLLMGFGFVALAHVPVSVTVFRWFVKKRGQALAIALIGMRLGGLIFTPLAALLIERLGWQTAFMVLGLSIWLLLLPIIILIVRNDPKDLGLLPDGDAAEVHGAASAATVASDPDTSVRAALKTSSFWVILGVYVPLYMSLVSMLVHQFPHITDVGYTPASAGMVVSAVLAFAAIGGLAFGWASDRLDARFLAAACIIMGAAAAVLLTQAVSPWLLSGYVVLFGLAYGGMDPVVAVVARRTFGAKAYGVVYGLYQSVICISGLVGVTLLGYVYDATSSYHWGFLMMAAGLTVSAVLLLCTRTAALVTVPGADPSTGAS